MRRLDTPEQATQALQDVGYVASSDIATVAFLADRLEKPLLVEGPAGVGKTELARALSAALERPMFRLQCYEGLDEAKALYEWEYAKQLLYTQLLRDKVSEATAGARSLAEAAERVAGSEAVFFSERFLLPRPVVQALRHTVPALLLVDEIDKADPEFEALLLEVLAENAVTIPELGTLKATFTPRVVLTSNNSRELSDALKRRCLHLRIGYPARALERDILKRHVPELDARLADQVVHAVHTLRGLELKKSPSISETIDWARALVLLSVGTLSTEWIARTLNLLLKHTSDVERATPVLHTLLEPAPGARNP